MIVRCQHCDHPLEIQEDWLGMEAPCPICGKNTKLLAAPEPAVVPVPVKSASKKISQSVLFGGIGLAAVVIVIGAFFCFRTESVPEKKAGNVVRDKEKKSAVSPERSVKKKTAAAQASGAVIPKIDPFDISDMVSGVPAVRKTGRKFKLEDHFAKLNPPPKGSWEKYRHISSYKLDRWKQIAEREAVFAVRNGFVHSLRFLLESGYDINGRYRSWEEYNNKKRADSLLQHLFRNIGADEFVKTYIFLVENGADVNAPFSDGTSLMFNLLKKCNYSKLKILWKLVPFTKAYGGKLDLFLLADARVNNAEFKKFAEEVIKRKFTRPKRVVENRLGKYWADAAKYKIAVPEVSGLTVINRAMPNDLIVCDYNVPRLTLTKLKAYMSKGGDINCLQLCSWGGHGGGSSARRAHYLVEYFTDLPLLQFLLVNGWRYGADVAYLNFRRFNECSELLWEFGADVNARHLNAVSDKKEWQKLLELYKRQRCQFGWEEINIRTEEYWDYQAAKNAVWKKDLDALKKVVEGGWDINSRPDNKEPLLHYALQGRVSIEIVKYLLDKKANIRNEGYKHCGIQVLRTCNMELIKLFEERSLLDFNETEALSAIMYLLGDAYNYKKDNFVAVFELVMNKWKLSPEKLDRYCMQKMQCSAYGVLLKQVCNIPRSYYKSSRKVVEMLEKYGFKPRKSDLAAVRVSSYEKKTLPEYDAWIKKLRRENP